jgi:transposase-like protein
MAVVDVQCPECGSDEVVRYGRQANDEQRYRCDNPHCQRSIFLLRYCHTGRLPHVKQPIVDMALNGSGIRDTARVLGVSPMTVMSTRKK